MGKEKTEIKKIENDNILYVGEYMCLMNDGEIGTGDAPAIATCEYVDSRVVCKYGDECQYQKEITYGDYREYPNLIKDPEKEEEE